MVIQSILWLALSYCIGSIPFGLVVAKLFCGIDPRESGSGNMGATNVARTCGTNWGILALVLDVLKGVLPVAVALALSDSVWFASGCALATILGHVFSMYLQFKGGKAVATTIGIFLPIAFWQILISVGLLVAVVATSGYMSLGSLTMVTAMPLLLLLFWKIELLPLALAVMILVFWRHKDNIGRLARGEESSWRKSKSQAAQEPHTDDAQSENSASEEGQ